jgi:hypothetical protein
MAYLLVLDLGLDVVDGVAALDLERDGLARQRLDEDLHLASPSLSLGLRTQTSDGGGCAGEQSQGGRASSII